MNRRKAVVLGALTLGAFLTAPLLAETEDDLVYLISIDKDHCGVGLIYHKDIDEFLKKVLKDYKSDKAYSYEVDYETFQKYSDRMGSIEYIPKGFNKDSPTNLIKDIK